MVDLHSHLVPAVDDGAGTEDEARSGLEVVREQEVSVLLVTPHADGSLTAQPDRLAERLAQIDGGWNQLRELGQSEFPDLRLERGAEVMLDTPSVDLSDPRLRLAGTAFALVEFPFMSVPPSSARAIAGLRERGWIPVIAHPERYTGLDEGLRIVEEWRHAGGLLQLNAGSLLGRYGKPAGAIAWRLLRLGWIHYLASDYHARGRYPLAEARTVLIQQGGAEQACLLLEENPARLLEGLDPAPVPPLEPIHTPLWRRIFRRR